MTRLLLSPDCGNSPKNKLIQDITVALARHDTRFLAQHLTAEVVWDLVGQGLHTGQAAVAAAVKAQPRPTVLTVLHVAQHGKAGAVNGTLAFKGGATHAFCHVFEFVSAANPAVRAITSYVIATASVPPPKLPSPTEQLPATLVTSPRARRRSGSRARTLATASSLRTSSLPAPAGFTITCRTR